MEVLTDRRKCVCMWEGVGGGQPVGFFLFGHFIAVPFWLGSACTRLQVHQAVSSYRQRCFASVTFKLQQRELCL